MNDGVSVRLSIITVSYNSSKTIQSTLDSIASQTYSDFELIIIDGFSQDSTLAIVRSYSELVTDCISEPDQGIYDAMNKGLQRATGEVICILNSDDFFLNHLVLDDVASIFIADPELDVLLGDVDFVRADDLNHPVRNYRVGFFKPWMLRFGLMPPHPAVFVRKSAYDRVGFYKLGYTIAADFDFLTRLLLIDKAKYKVLSKTLVRMRMGGVSTSGFISNIISTREMKRSLNENGFFASGLMLMSRLPFKLFTQVLR
jgi:glycosyltransferase involved in cell wall biosynthesis